jgi:hypothetical protein
VRRKSKCGYVFWMTALPCKAKGFPDCRLQSLAIGCNPTGKGRDVTWHRRSRNQSRP